MPDIERIEIDGKVYRKVALTGIQEADGRRGPQDPAPADWFFAWIPESRFGTEHPEQPIARS